MGVLEGCLTSYECDAGHLHELLNTRAQLLHNAVLVLQRLWVVFILQRSSMTERLRWDAPTVQACSAGVLLLKDYYLQPVLCCMFCCAVTTGTATNDNKVCLHCFFYFLVTE